ncbi:zinc finger protein 268 [Drosophila innubila]|uniref:zinc finger protein 268 n=1 Tax=Drosophila innubila TaxID=198719 RepID=UPI00148C9470|nr:zinc finger protein 268 [Drosophila innubila]
MHLQKIQAKITPISVPIYELPEFLCVETKCITPKFAMENNIQGVSNITRSLANKLQDDKSEIDNSKPTTQLAQSAKIEPEKNPCRERSVQVNLNPTVDVEVQCQRDSSDEWELANDLLAKSTETNESEERENEGKFLEYASQHTEMFPNGMLECLVCGEIANSLQEQHSHMTVHFGPQALCSGCGKMVESQSLIGQHNYSCLARVNAKSRPIINMQCPHLHCSVTANSKRELTRHLSKHLGINSYYCLQCRKSFSSVTQFLVHRLREAACSKAKHIYLAKNISQWRKKSNPKRCTVCLKQFSSTRNCVWHKRRCILANYRRLKKLLKPLCKF